MRSDVMALGLAAAILATLPIYAIASRGKPLDAEVAKRPASVLLGYWIRDWIMWLIGPIERFFVRTEISPDIFNYAGAVFGAAAGFAYANRALALAGWLILLGGACDIFDGRIARARGITDQRGAFLDSTLDRFSETFAFMGVALYYATRPWEVLATALALGGSMLVSYARARGEALGVNCKEGIMQRAERLVLLALASLLDGAITSSLGWEAGSLLFGAIVIIGVGSLGTAIFRTVYITRQLGGGR